MFSDYDIVIYTECCGGGGGDPYGQQGYKIKLKPKTNQTCARVIDGLFGDENENGKKNQL